jgi:hypothetical protein
MSCSNFRIVILQVMRGEAVDDAVRQDALVHARFCDACSNYLAKSQDLTEALAAIAASGRSVEAPPSVEERLLSAFRAGSPVTRSTGSTSLKVSWMVGLAAAAVILTIGAIGWRLVNKSRKVAPTSIAVDSRSVRVLPAPDSTLVPPVEQNRRQSTRPASRKPQVVSSGTEDLQGFLPLPTDGDSGRHETVAMVHIQLQPAALEALGIPRAEVNSARPITADVLIGDDGMAQAIRFDQ